jgi:hypothetical protein
MSMSDDAKKPNLNELDWSDIKVAKIIRMAFRDNGRLIDSTEHILVQQWAGRDGINHHTTMTPDRKDDDIIDYDP